MQAFVLNVPYEAAERHSKGTPWQIICRAYMHLKLYRQDCMGTKHMDHGRKSAGRNACMHMQHKSTRDLLKRVCLCVADGQPGVVAAYPSSKTAFADRIIPC